MKVYLGKWKAAVANSSIGGGITPQQELLKLGSPSVELLREPDHPGR